MEWLCTSLLAIKYLLVLLLGLAAHLVFRIPYEVAAYSPQMGIFRLREAPSVGLSDLTNENTGNIVWDIIILKKYLFI